ncbi:hypothetical protein J6590_041373 [Homalodisca vitripennis]|nr:hypothetical protein J6590_041373 [Homalodisca vitripennis]
MKGAKILRKPITDEIVSRCTSGEEPIKCLLVISKARSAKFVCSLLNKLVDRQGQTFAAGGGEIKHYECNAGNRHKITTGRYHSLWFVPSYVFIAFRGDGVSAHSEILYHEDAKDINTFMKQLAERVGPVPEGGSRIAFLAQCVARTDPFLENEESSAFSRAFPSVPQFGFHALGEYGMSSSSTVKEFQWTPSGWMGVGWDVGKGSLRGVREASSTTSSPQQAPQQLAPNPHPEVSTVLNISNIIEESIPKATSLNSKGPIKNC